jgi:type IX secretion system PorP/SprF family membrane protein
MKNLSIKMLLLPATFFVCACAMAQDADFTQFYNNPVFTNPAAAGSSAEARISLSYRNQWPSLPGTFITGVLAYDQHIKSLHGGIGIVAMHDRTGSATFRASTISGIYSYQVNLTEKLRLSVGGEATFYRKAIDFEKMPFHEPNEEPRSGFRFLTHEPLPRRTRSFANFSSGALLYSNRFYAGFAMHNLTEPNQSWYNKKHLALKLPARYTLHAGLTLPLDKKTWAAVSERTTLSPNILFMQQNNYRQAALSVNMNIRNITAGLGYRLTDELNFISVMAGCRMKKVNIFYSLDYSNSYARPTLIASHELTLLFKPGAK